MYILRHNNNVKIKGTLNLLWYTNVVHYHNHNDLFLWKILKYL